MYEFTRKVKSISTTRTVVHVLTALILSTVLIRIFGIDSFTVTGNSMAPTIVSGDYVFVHKFAYVHHEPARGDIVVGNFRESGVPKVIKRVIGLPREWVRIEDGKAYVSAARSEEGTEVREYIEGTPQGLIATSTFKYHLDPYEYFLMGDNQSGSVDSKELGPVDVYDIDGRVFLKINLKDLNFKLI